MLQQQLKALFPQALHILVLYKKIKHCYIRVEKPKTVRISVGLHILESQIYQWCLERQTIINASLEKQHMEMQTEAGINNTDLKILLLHFVNKWQSSISVPVQRIRVNSNMTRAWGKCYYQKGLLTFSDKLKFCSFEAIEYVVVHEMVHLLVHDHSAKFWDKVAELLPDWQQRRASLQ